MFSPVFYLILLHLSLMPGHRTEKNLQRYRTELSDFRHEFGRSKDIPDVKFFLFGMGNRTKMIFKSDTLKNALTGEIIKTWPGAGSVIIPPDYTVCLTLQDGSLVEIREDQEAVWITESGHKYALPGTLNPVNLPDFRKYRYGLIMKVLHHEILINIVNSKPLPNFFVYDNPWRRDGAMMAMCLDATGNISLIRDWVMSLEDPYDQNNAGETEADNLGQTLYLLSFFTDNHYPLVGEILEEVSKREVKGTSGTYILGRSDFHETPVYQTKWLKFGLRAMHLKDNYVIPDIRDDYSALFWWDFREYYAEGTDDADDKENYPYLGWACDHFHRTKASPISNSDYPLTWEIEASQASYAGLSAIDSVYMKRKIASPHTWHASEVFLYLLEMQK
jgi:hypothetical protein